MDLLDLVRREMSRASRALRRAPSFSFIAILTLALGLGAATTIFTLLDRVVLRPLPYPTADRLVHLGTLWPKVKQGEEYSLSKGQYFFFRQNSRVLRDLLLYDRDILLVPGDGAHPAERVSELDVSANTFSMLGIRLARGRYFTVADERNPDGDPRVALISYEYWQRRFGGDDRALGARIPYGDNSLEIIGVLAPGAAILDASADVWTRNYLDPNAPPQNNHTHHAVGLLKPGVSIAAAAADIDRVQALMIAQYPNVYPKAFLDRSGFAMHVSALRDYVLGDSIARVLWLLFGGVAVVLLVAAANVSNLYLVRIEARQQEAAVRAALGASRGQLAMHYVSESLLLALAAGAAAIGLAWMLLHFLLRIAPQSLPRLAEVTLDWRSAAFCLVVSLALGVVFGLLPLAARTVDVSALREGSRGLTATRSRQLARRGLVLAQVALGVVLLSAGLLLAKSFSRLRHVDPGFEPTGAQSMLVMLPYSRQVTDDQVVALWRELTTRVGTIPGVAHAGAGESLPLTGDQGCSSIVADGADDLDHASACMPWQRVTPGYLEALGMRVRGTRPTWAAIDAGESPAVVTAAFAKRFWPTTGAVGRGLKPFNARNPSFAVTGITSDLRANGLEKPPSEEAFVSIVAPAGTKYWPASRAMYLIVRAPTLSQGAVVSRVRRVLGELEPRAAIADVQSMEAIVAASMAQTSFAMLLLLISAALALSLSAVGTYGVISYLVTHRRREIGIRMALGAQPGAIARLVIGESLVVSGAGAAVGVALALATTRVLRSQLFEVSPSDPLVLGGTAVVLVIIALLATLLPVRGATRIVPVEAMRAS